MVRLQLKVHSHMSRVPTIPVLSASTADVELASEIVKRSKAFVTGADGVLFNEGDPPTCLYFVRAGQVLLTMQSGDKEVMRVRAGAGSLLGLPAIVGNQPYTLMAKAEQGAEVFRFASDTFYELMSLTNERLQLCCESWREKFVQYILLYPTLLTEPALSEAGQFSTPGAS